MSSTCPTCGTHLGFGHMPPLSARLVQRTVGDVVLRQLAHELVEALETTNWSSWQTTANFQDQLDALRALLKDHPNDH